MFDPSVGRWISEDPIGFEGGDADLYRYVGNEPVIATDASGLASEIPSFSTLVATELAPQPPSNSGGGQQQQQGWHQEGWGFVYDGKRFIIRIGLGGGPKPKQPPPQPQPAPPPMVPPGYPGQTPPSKKEKIGVNFGFIQILRK